MRHNTKGFSLIEITISMLMISVLFVASMQTVAWSKKTSHIGMQEDIAQNLAQDLMSEVLMQDYRDKIYYRYNTNVTEQSRANYRSIIDYHNYAEAQIKDKAGNIRTELPGWGRKVIVQFYDPELKKVCADDKGIRKITVFVAFNSVVVDKLVGFRNDLIKPF